MELAVVGFRFSWQYLLLLVVARSYSNRKYATLHLFFITLQNQTWLKSIVYSRINSSIYYPTSTAHMLPHICWKGKCETPIKLAQAIFFRPCQLTLKQAIDERYELAYRLVNRCLLFINTAVYTGGVLRVC